MANYNQKMYGAALSTAMMGVFLTVPNVYGATPTEQLSNTVEVLCPQLKGINSSNPELLTAAEKDVLFRCGEVKRAPGQSFDQLSSDQEDALNNMTNDESSVMGTSTVELSGAQNVAILGRLTVLRGKSSSSVAAHNPTQNENEITANGKNSLVSSNNTDAASGLGVDEEFVGLTGLPAGIDGSFSQMSEQGKWGLFLTGSYGTGDKDATSIEPGFDFDSWSLVAGVDYRLSQQFVLGLALGYAVTDSSVDDNGGDVDLDGVGISVYGSYYLKDFYIDFLAGFASKEFETTRIVQYGVPATAGGRTSVDQTFNGDTDATDFNLSVGGGYNLSLGGVTVTPYGQVAYLDSDIDGYTESLNGSNTDPGFGLALDIEDQEIESLTSTIGVHVAKTINTSGSVITPYLKADWEHEFENDERNIVAGFADVRAEFDELNVIIIPTEEPDRDYFNLGAGVSAVLPGGYQLFFDYATLLGYDDLSLHTFVAGLRMEF